MGEQRGTGIHMGCWGFPIVAHSYIVLVSLLVPLIRAWVSMSNVMGYPHIVLCILFIYVRMS